MRAPLSARVFRHERARPHVGPVCIDVIKAAPTGILSKYHDPAGWNIDIGRPERMLALVVYEHDVCAILVFKWIRSHIWSFPGDIILKYCKTPLVPRLANTERPC